MEENRSSSPIQPRNSDQNLEKLDAILDLISLDDHAGDDRHEVVQPVPQEARGVYSSGGNGLLINFEDAEGDPGPSTMEWMRKAKGGGKAKGRGKPDFRRIRQLLDDEAPSSSDVDAGYELDSGLETPGSELVRTYVDTTNQTPLVQMVCKLQHRQFALLCPRDRRI
jgi:hypothetical protein